MRGEDSKTGRLETKKAQIDVQEFAQLMAMYHVSAMSSQA